MKLLKSLRKGWEKAIVRLRTRELAPGVALFEYGADRDAAYRSYRETQEAGNKRKIHKQWVQEPHVAFLADYVNRALGATSKTTSAGASPISAAARAISGRKCRWNHSW